MENKREFLHTVQDYAGIQDEDEVERVTQAVLSTLRSRISNDEAEHVKAQLPNDVVPLWEGGLMDRVKNAFSQPDFNYGGFVRIVADDLGYSPGEVEQLSQAVFHTLKEHISDGQAQHVADQLPQDLQRAWQTA